MDLVDDSCSVALGVGRRYVDQGLCTWGGGGKEEVDCGLQRECGSIKGLNLENVTKNSRLLHYCTGPSEFYL